MTGPNWKLEDDYKTITVTFPTNPVVVLKLDVTEVNKMIEMLGMMRSAMKPEVSKDFSFGQKVSAVPDPCWRTEPDLLQGHSLLHLCHPGFGWLHFLMPPHEAKRLAQILQTQAENRPHATAGSIHALTDIVIVDCSGSRNGNPRRSLFAYIRCGRLPGAAVGLDVE